MFVGCERMRKEGEKGEFEGGEGKGGKWERTLMERSKMITARTMVRTCFTLAAVKIDREQE